MLRQVAASPFGQSTLIFFSFSLIVALLAWVFQPLIIPLIASFVMYSLLEPFCSRLISCGLSQAASAGIVILGLIVSTVVIILLVVPVILSQLTQLQSQLPLLWDKFLQFIQHINQWLGESLNVTLGYREGMEPWFGSLQLMGANALVSSASFIAQVVGVVFLVPIITFFLLRDFRVARNAILGWLPNSGFELGWLIYYRIAKQLQDYLRGVITQSFIVACIAAIGFYALGMELAFLYGLMTGVLNVIPYIGPIMAMLPPMLVEMSSGSLDIWLILGIFSIILMAQIIDNLFVVPTVIAGTVGLHPLVVVFGVIIFGYVFGVVGMLLAIPVLASVKIVTTGLYFGLEGNDHSRSY